MSAALRISAATSAGRGWRLARPATAARVRAARGRPRGPARCGSCCGPPPVRASCHSSRAPSSRTPGRMVRAGARLLWLPSGSLAVIGRCWRRCAPPASSCGASLRATSRAPRRATLPHFGLVRQRALLRSRDPCLARRAADRRPSAAPDARSLRGRVRVRSVRPPAPVGRRGPPSSFGAPAGGAPSRAAARLPWPSWAARAGPSGSLSCPRPSIGTRPRRPGVWLGAARLLRPATARPLASRASTGPTVAAAAPPAPPERPRPSAGEHSPGSTCCPTLGGRGPMAGPGGAPIWPRGIAGHRAILRDSRDAVAGGRTDQRRGRRHVPGGPAGSAEPARRSRRRSRSAGTRPAARGIAADGGGNDETPSSRSSEGVFVMRNPGGDLLSQGASPQVPSARAGLTAVFGMGTGVSPPPWPPETVRSAGSPAFDVRRREPRLWLRHRSP